MFDRVDTSFFEDVLKRLEEVGTRDKILRMMEIDGETWPDVWHN